MGPHHPGPARIGALKPAHGWTQRHAACTTASRGNDNPPRRAAARRCACGIDADGCGELGGEGHALVCRCTKPEPSKLPEHVPQLAAQKYAAAWQHPLAQCQVARTFPAASQWLLCGFPHECSRACRTNGLAKWQGHWTSTISMWEPGSLQRRGAQVPPRCLRHCGMRAGACR